MEVSFRWVGSLLEHNEQWMGGRYVTMLIYSEEINMTIIIHVVGVNIIDTALAAGVVYMLDEENG